MPFTVPGLYEGFCKYCLCKDIEQDKGMDQDPGK